MAFLYLEKKSREASFGLNEKANNDKLNDRFYRIRQIQTMRSEFRIISYFAKITFKIVSWNFLFCEMAGKHRKTGRFPVLLTIILTCYRIKADAAFLPVALL